MIGEKVLKSGPTSKVVIAVSSIAIAGLAAFNWFVSPQMAYLHATEKYETMIGSAGEKGVMITNGISSKETELNKLRLEVSRLRNSLFTVEKSREFFSDLEPISLQNGCSIESLTFLPPESRGQGGLSNVIRNQAKLSLIGRYENVIKFLEKIRAYPQRISISNFIIQTSRYDINELICQMSITIYVIEDEDKENENNEK